MRTLLRTMCRLSSGFTADAAHRVMGEVAGVDAVAVDDALESLVSQSLLGVDEEGGSTRHRMLEMVREFGEERLAETRRRPGRRGGDGAEATACAEGAQVRFDAGDIAALRPRWSPRGGNLVWILRRCVDRCCSGG